MPKQNFKKAHETAEINASWQCRGLREQIAGKMVDTNSVFL